jgi:dihydroxy-acid dehydratase
MRMFSARQSGKALMDMVKNNIKPSDIMTRKALENAITVLGAIGGSLNALLHIPALAYELGLEMSWDDISKITSKTPLLTDIVPNCNKTVIELYKAGGIPAVMKELSSLLNLDEKTVTGRTVSENIKDAVNKDENTIRTIKNPLKQADGIQVLYGNLAPKGALVKTSAVPEQLKKFIGKAKVFNNEDECYEAFHKNDIKEGDAIIIRYEGPKGGPGMKEMHRVTEIVKAIPNTAVITDGRFSGASGGLSVGYLCPEATEGGPIAFLENGDEIIVDLIEETINVNLSEQQLEERRKKWAPIEQPGVTRFLRRYSERVESSNKGAILK